MAKGKGFKVGGTRAACDVCYNGETTRDICTHAREHLELDKGSHVYKHLQSSEAVQF